MAGRTLPNIGLTGFWALGEDAWKDDNDLNLLRLSVLVQAGALGVVSATPGAPTDGDVYIFSDTHPTQPNKVAVRDNGAWVYLTPLEGWLIYDRSSAMFQLFDGSAWAAFAPATGGGSADELRITDYGAVDGVSGAAAAFSAAVAALPAAGGIIRIPPGDWQWESSVTIARTDVRVIASPGATMTRSMTGAFIVLSGDRNEIIGGKWDGNKAVVTTGGGILWVTGARNFIERAWVTNGHAQGIGLDGQSTTCSHNYLRDCVATSCDGVGFSQNKATHTTIENPYTSGTGLEGITIDNQSHLCRVIGGYVINTCSIGGVGGIGIDYAERCSIVGTLIDTVGSSLPGIKTQNNLGASNYNSFTGITIVGSTKGIWLYNGTGGGSAYNVIDGCVFQNTGSIPIQIDAGCNNNRIGANTYNGDPIVNNGTGNARAGMELIGEASPTGTTVTFSSIPARFRDLRVVIRGRGTTAAATVQVIVRLNNDSGANYDRQRMSSANTAVSAAATMAATDLFALSTAIPAASAPAGVAGAFSFEIFDYAGTTFQKQATGTQSVKSGTTTADVQDSLLSGWWRNTAAVNRIDVILSAGNFAAGSTVSLYGIN